MTYLIQNIKPIKYTLRDICSAQNDYLGYISYTNPKLLSYAYVTEVDAKYSAKFTIYCLDTGKTKVVKTAKKTFTHSPVDLSRAFFCLLEIPYVIISPVFTGVSL